MRHYEAKRGDRTINFVANHFQEAIDKSIRLFALAYPKDKKDTISIRFILNEAIEWQKCPKCDGQGIVSKPPNIAGDQQEWTSTSISHTCNVCNGQKIIPKALRRIEAPKEVSE